MSFNLSENLNEACGVLSADHTSVSAKLEAVQIIPMSGDASACDFSLGLPQDMVISAIIAMVSKHYPQCLCKLVYNLVHALIVDIIVYCILHQKMDGWIYCRTPSVLCNLLAVICEDLVRQHIKSTRCCLVIYLPSRRNYFSEFKIGK